MKIQDLFERDIHREINGVVKADQVDASSIWQELDEFVVTKELTGYFSDVVSVLLSSQESDTSTADSNGIWVSGFFGSGKSHFIKVLSYLLENAEHEHEGTRRRAVEFFDDKLDDALLFAELKRVVAVPTETILFNIGSKADQERERHMLLRVFLKVLNEKQGFSGDHPHIAHMERYLDEQGKLDEFHASFEAKAGKPWLELRDAWELNRDQLSEALQDVLGQSAESIEKWIDGSEDHFSLTIENFAKWVNHYLASRGPKSRLMFLVDEVGQFIGTDTHLMLNLQTITEQLGTICEGRAWVVVTSQEDLDSVLGDLKETKSQDFSKIQGRFKTRLSLSAGNVDEVIQSRLLAKNEAAGSPLRALYAGKHDILKNQLSFTGANGSFKAYEDEADFAACYPFAAYQFLLVQKVFESIRKVGASGRHLSEGERSMLEAFQTAAKKFGAHELGTLVPMAAFYPAVKSFLDGKVKRTIEQAGENHDLKPFDSTLLQVLFLIRYVDELPGQVDNLVTLFVDQVDADKLQLKRTIEESLQRLEGQTLVSRNGDLYFFLTDEERDIGQQIKNVTIPSNAAERELGKLIFEDILGDHRKHEYSLTGKTFDFTRSCDDQYMGHAIEGAVEVAVVTPMGDRYAEFGADGACVLETTAESAKVLVRLGDDPALGRDLRAYWQTETYVKAKNTHALPETTKRILRDRSDENRERRVRLVAKVRSMIEHATYFASGQKLSIARTEPKQALSDALESLIKNAYPKMGYITHQHPHPKQEIQSILRANDIARAELIKEEPEANPKALAEVREYVSLCDTTSKRIVLHEIIDERFGQRPYGWPELEVVRLVARLAVLKEIELQVDQAPLTLERAYDYLTATNKQKKVVIKKRVTADEALIKAAQELGRTLFATPGPATETGQYEVLKKGLGEWGDQLRKYEGLATTGSYPGLTEIQSCLDHLKGLEKEPNSLAFLKRFVGRRAELETVADDYQELDGFYTNQRHAWEQVGTSVEALTLNRSQLERHGEAGAALSRLEEIRRAPKPYSMLSEVAPLIAKASAVNEQLVGDARRDVLGKISERIQEVEAELDAARAADELREQVLLELDALKQSVATLKSIAHIRQAEHQSEEAYDKALDAIEKAIQPPPSGVGETEPPPDVLPPTLKRRRVIEVRSLWPKAYLEEPDEMEAFLKSLRAEIEAALDSGERIQLK